MFNTNSFAIIVPNIVSSGVSSGEQFLTSKSLNEYVNYSFINDSVHTVIIVNMHPVSIRVRTRSFSLVSAPSAGEEVVVGLC